MATENTTTTETTTETAPATTIAAPQDPQDIVETRKAETDKKLLELSKTLVDEPKAEEPKEEEAKADGDKKDEEKKPEKTDKEKRIDLEKWEQKNRTREKAVAAKEEQLAKIQEENNQLHGWVQELVQLRDSEDYDAFLEKIGLPIDKLIKAKYEQAMGDPRDKKYKETETQAQKALREAQETKEELKKLQESLSSQKQKLEVETALSSMDLKAEYPLVAKAQKIYGKQALSDTVYDWIKQGYSLEDVLGGIENNYKTIKGTPNELKWMAEEDEEKPASLGNAEPAKTSGVQTKPAPSTITSGGAGGNKKFTSVEERRAAIDAKMSRM